MHKSSKIAYGWLFVNLFFTFFLVRSTISYVCKLHILFIINCKDEFYC
jgi:hypothetical protein